MESLSRLLSGESFIPHGHCYLWKPGLVWLHGFSDAAIALAYFTIALSLLYVLLRRKDVPFRGILWLFSAFIGACGITHLLQIWTLWWPVYWLSGSAKALTALVSVYTGLTLVPHIPQVLALKSPDELDALNQSLTKKIATFKETEAKANRLNQSLELQVVQQLQDLGQVKSANERLLQQEQSVRTALDAALGRLQTTTERLNIALSAAQMGSWDWGLAENKLCLSSQAKAILGLPRETTDVSYSAWISQIHSDDLARVETALQKAQEDRSVFSQEYRILQPDQTVHWVLTEGRCLLSTAGVPTRFLGVMKEITHRKESELALKASESRFRTVFEQAAVGMARLSSDGCWQQVNETFCSLLGYTSAELIGHSFSEITDPADRAQDAYYYQQLVQGKATACRFEKRYLHKDGASIWTLVTVSTERSEAGEVLAFIAVVEDIRALKVTRLELQARAAELEQTNGILATTNALLEKRNTELNQFAYVASHDLKAPLRAIANLSEWIEEDLGEQLPAENQHQLALLRGRVHRMEALINGLLEYSRVGRVEGQTQAVDVAKLLQEVVELLAPPPSFTISIPCNLPTLQTDRIALQQVFSNLISNAIKHHHRGQGHIEVTARDHKDEVEFVVIDDGPGIAPQYHQKIFTIFQTLRARDDFESTGVGLAIVQKIVESAGGTLALESAPGKGTRFRFTWPKAA